MRSGGAVVAGAFHCDGVNLIDKEDGGSILSGGLEQLVDHVLTDADVLLEELVAFGHDEGCVGFARHCLGEHGFARARRAVEQHALGGLCAGTQEFFGSPQEINKVAQLLLGVLCADDVVKANIGLGDIAQHVLGVLGVDGGHGFKVEEHYLCGLAVVGYGLRRLKCQHLIGLGKRYDAVLLMQVFPYLTYALRKILAVVG